MASVAVYVYPEPRMYRWLERSGYKHRRLIVSAIVVNSHPSRQQVGHRHHYLVHMNGHVMKVLRR